MVIGVGTDILQTARLEAVSERLGERFTRRILTVAECEAHRDSAMPTRLLAKRFAAKEAVAKALGTGIGRGVSWQDIELSHDSYGAPRVTLTGGALEAARRRGGERIEISIADEVDYVVAFAVLTT
jgi:holo-[acyl-carrier protein] synthase